MRQQTGKMKTSICSKGEREFQLFFFFLSTCNTTFCSINGNLSAPGASYSLWFFKTLLEKKKKTLWQQFSYTGVNQAVSDQRLTELTLCVNNNTILIAYNKKDKVFGVALVARYINLHLCDKGEECAGSRYCVIWGFLFSLGCNCSWDRGHPWRWALPMLPLLRNLFLFLDIFRPHDVNHQTSNRILLCVFHRVAKRWRSVCI